MTAPNLREQLYRSLNLKLTKAEVLALMNHFGFYWRERPQKPSLAAVRSQELRDLSEPGIIICLSRYTLTEMKHNDQARVAPTNLCIEFKILFVLAQNSAWFS